MPPPGRGWMARVAPWAAVMACTIDSPRPRPLGWPARSAPSRWNGRKSRSTSAGGTTGPLLTTVRTALPSRVSVATSMWPWATLWFSALSTRLAASRSASRGSPAAGAADSAACTSRSRSSASGRRARRTWPASPARSKGSQVPRPACPRARVRSASMSCSCWAPAARTRSCAARRVSAVASGSARATWLRIRCLASGVRSSCEALATNWRWALNDASSRASSPSKVSPSSLSSSSGPPRASRSCRLVAEISRAAAVMVRSGRSTRPATSQPRPMESTAIPVSASPDWMSSWCSSAAC